MIIANFALGAIALLALPLQEAAAWSSANHDTKMISADTSRANPSRRQLEPITSVDMGYLWDYFGTTLEIKLKKLPTSGVAVKTPWPGATWSYYLDGINYEWNNHKPSPAKNYAQAFGLDVKTFMDAVSRDFGIDSQVGEIQCTMDSDCINNNGLFKSLRLCVARKGRTDHICVTEDLNIGYGWAAASFLENEPRCSVTYNNTIFQPMDIKGLLTEVYQYRRTPNFLVGTRFEVKSTSFDEFGRHLDPSFRDVNAGIFHIVATNLLGRLNASFIIDADAGVTESDRPVVGFQVYNQTALSLKEAAKTFYGIDSYRWNVDAASVVYVNSSLTWINETYTDGGLVASGQVQQFTQKTFYTYLLELNKDDEIIGGEWIGASNTNHPDFIWFPTEKVRQNFATPYGLKYADVEMLAKKSAACSR